MGGEAVFSEEWHRFYGENVRPSDRQWLTEIEEQLAHYQSIWNGVEGTDYKSLDETDVETASDRLKVAAHYVDLILRVVLCRSIHLIRAFIDAMNREDFESAPFLLRAVMEQAAFGIYAARRIRGGFEAYRGNPNGEQLLKEAQFSTFFGAKINYGAFLAGIEERVSEGRFDYDAGEWDLIKDLIERGQFSEKTVPKEFRGLTIEMISKMLDAVDLDAERLQEGAPAGAFRAIWEHLSQYCHPSIFSWSFNRVEVLEGGRYSPSQEDRTILKRMALDRFVQPMWEWVHTLPRHAIEKLAALESEIEQEAEALEGKP